MRYLIYLSIISLLTGCLSANKLGPESAVYDFGLQGEAVKTNTKINIGKVSAEDAIDHHRIRYRLNYQNPAQVFSYTQSRWSSSPAELLAAKMRSMTSVSNVSSCSIRIHIEAFDQVFETADRSSGVVKLHATLFAQKSRQPLFNHLVQENVLAPSADAKGGVAALNEASTKAIVRILEWADTAAAQAPECMIPTSQPARVNDKNRLLSASGRLR